MPSAVVFTTLPATKSITLGTADNVTLITTPPRCGLVSVLFDSTNGKVVLPDEVTAQSLAQDGAIGSSEYVPCTAGTWYPIDIRPTGPDEETGSRTFAITGSSSAVAHVLVERGES